jgi:hypothetical protein
VVSSVLRKLDKLSNENYKASSSWELWRRRKAESVPFGNPGAKTYQKLQRTVLHRGFNSEREQWEPWRLFFQGTVERPYRIAEEVFTRKCRAVCY